ncbi:ion transporter [Sphingomonas sp. HDW15A]|uniref:ion transporter n=1 Tax=Sphingomonas sp. HDW15A TaxID=2714942 RepID=UPI00140AC52B|nr:ion transporter [Sphingomonas sp. HDW15A]QIK96316.1 ion transporter [Sphingomonas sp. HDW15A]
MALALRRRVYEELEPGARGEFGLSLVNKTLVLFIIVASALAILETEETIAGGYPEFFRGAELLFGFIFSIEYLLRLWVAPENPQWAKHRYSRLRYAFSAPAIIDFLAIVPTLASLGPGGGSLLLRFFRILRILRLAKLGRMSHALHDLGRAVHERRHELILTVGIAGFVLLVASTLMYWAEADAQPEKFGSIPRSMWWCIITLTTVGYGDAYPVTVLGKMLSGLVAIAGIGLIAMPTGILAAAFSDVVQRRREAAAKLAAEQAAAQTGRDRLPGA